MAKLSVIEGIGPAYETKLKEAGITSIEDLLIKCSSKKNRTKLAENTGITEKLILKWANHADLFRIKGIGGEYAELLEASGVDTVPELSKRKADKLFIKLSQVNAAQKLVRKLPAQKHIESWIQQASNLPKALSY